jgi:DNA sulfur modification protein DndB
MAEPDVSNFNEVLPLLGPLLTTPRSLAREANSRKKEFNHETISRALLDEYLQEGWELCKELKVKVQVSKPRTHDENLENQVWRMLYLMGYGEMNSGRQFKIAVRKGKETISRKQVDIFAKDDETVIIAECKSSREIGRRSLQKDLEEFANLKGSFAKTIRTHYGDDFKPKIVFLFCTRNVIWSDPDRKRAAAANIQVITERELRYFMQVADHLRHAARYQFLGEFLKDQKIPELEDAKLPAIRGKLAGRKFFCFVIKAKDLLKIAFINHRSLSDPDGAPAYQRLVSRTRLKQIRGFLEKGGFFPNNLLVNFPKPVTFEPVTKATDDGISYGNITLPNRYRSAWVIDGQHRLYAYSGTPKKSKDANLIVVAFEGLPKEEEANMFVTINHEQKTVPKNLLDDLEGELKWGSDMPSEKIGAICARLIGLLNHDIGEPLYNRVSQQGIKPTEESCLTVPAIKNALRRSKLLGESRFNNKEFSPGFLSDTTDSKSVDRARRAINLYFSQIKAANEKLWGEGRDSVICTNTGVSAFLLLLDQLISYMEGETSNDARQLTPEELIEEVSAYLDPILAWLGREKREVIEKNFKVPYGSGGPPEYFNRLVVLVKSEYPDFVPEGFSDWEIAQSEDRISEADRQIKSINVSVQKIIFDKLKQEYGIEKNAYWEKGVKNSAIRIKAYTKAQEYDSDERLALEHYLDFIEYKKIIEESENWKNLFKDIFDIPLPGDKGKAKNLGWMDEVNNLRRIAAHATEDRKYSAKDFEFLDWLVIQLENRSIL